MTDEAKPVVKEPSKEEPGKEPMVEVADKVWKPFWYHPSLVEEVEEASMNEEAKPVVNEPSKEPAAEKLNEPSKEPAAKKLNEPSKEPAAEKTNEHVSTPSPGKPKAGSKNKPRTFLTSSERYGRTNGKDEEEEEEEEDGGFEIKDDDSTSTYKSSSSTESEPTPSKKIQKPVKPASHVSPLKAAKVPPPVEDNDAAKGTQGEEDRKPAAKLDHKKGSEYFMAMFPGGSTHKKPEGTTNPNAGTRATEKKRLVGQHPGTERQQMDDKVRKQFALTCKHDVKLMPMMTPISKMDGFLETAATRSDLESVAEETLEEHHTYQRAVH